MSTHLTQQMTKNCLRRLIASALFLIMLVAVAPHAVAATKTVTVGTQSSRTTFVPVCATWHDTWSETIYTSDLLADIPEGSVIKTIGYNGISSVAVDNIQYEVYVKNTSASTAPADHSDLSDFTCIFNGTTSIPKSDNASAVSELLTVDAQKEFTYDGGNLHVVVKAHIPELPSAGVNFSYQTIQKCTLLTLSNDNWQTYNKYNYNYLPVMNLCIELPSGYVDLTKVTVGDDGPNAKFGMSTPLSFNENNSMSSSLYTSDILGIPANMDIHEISYKGCIYTISTASHRIRVWMANTSETEVPAQAPALTAMTQVLDKEIVLDKKVGSHTSLTEILRLKLDTPFRYTGGNLLVTIQTDNETTQYVYFAYTSSYTGKSIYGYGSSDDMSAFKFYSGNFPATNLYYAAPAVEETPEISLVTERGAGQNLGFRLTSRDGVRVDWGGRVSEYPYGGTLVLNNNLAGSEIKIWTMSKDDHIDTFICNSSDITSVSLEAPGLKSLELKGNKLDSIDISGCPVLETLNLSGNQIYEFAAESTTLRELDLSHNNLAQLIITDCSAMEYLDVSVNSLRYPIWLFWPKADNLRYLNIAFNQILNFDLSGYPNLKTLICNHNNISSLDLSQVPALEVLRTGFTKIRTLDVAKCPDLKVLDICGTEAGTTRLNSNIKLEELNLRLTGISSVDLSANTALRHLNLAQNSLSSVDLSANKALEHLDVNKNTIASLDLSALRSLRFLDCSSNGLSALDVRSNAALDSLYCSINNLTELPLPAGNHIKFLDFASNSISVQPDNIESVVYLNCSDNKWTSTDFAKTPEIKGIDIHSNLLDKDALMSMFRQLPDVNGIEIPKDDSSWMTVLNYNDNPGTSDVSSDIAETKGWKCSYKPDIIGDASAAIVIPADKVYTSFSFDIDTPDAIYYVDWGDGVKKEFRTENPQYTYNSITGYAEGEIIRIYAPGTTELGISNAFYDAVDVSGMPELLRLSCSGNNFTSLDLSSNLKLVDLNCRKNPLTSVTFPADCKLTSLDCSSTLIRSLDLARTPLLKHLAVSSCRLENLDLSPVPGLMELRAESNSLQNVDLSGLEALVYAYLSDNELSSVNISDNKKLEILTVDHNKIGSIDLSGHNNLKRAHVNNNSLTNLTLDNPVLTVLLASNNSLEKVDLSKAPALSVASIENNNLDNLDLTGNTDLAEVYAKKNRITNVRFAQQMSNLKLVNLSDNKLSSINLEAMPAVTALSVSGNNITGTLDLSQNTAINYLNVSHNAIKALQWGSASSIATLYASYNKLTTLAVPGAGLSIIDCSRNQLEAVDLSGNTSLFYLVLDFNKLSSVNLASNQKLTGVSLRANSLDSNEIGKICTQLPNVSSLGIVDGGESWMKQLFLSGNPGCAEANVSPAVQKGWNVVMNEDIPIDRVLTLTVVDNSDAPVENATLILMVNGEDVGTKAVETAPGVYVYNPLPVFNSLTYEVRIEKQGYQTRVVDVNDVIEGDLALTVILTKDTGSVEDIAADKALVSGGKGCIKVCLPEAADIMVFDIAGRPVFKGLLPVGENIIDNFAPGIYIVLGHKVNVF